MPTKGDAMEIKNAIIMIGIIAIVAIWFRIWRRLRPNAYHRRMRRQSKRALAMLQERARENPGSVIAYMRKMNPHAVEELVLDAAKAAGHRIRRNNAYVGDGGVDGEIFVEGLWHLVQTKRYSSAINPKHVADFNAVCAKKAQFGLFIHVGRTGEKSKDIAAPYVRFISGQALIDLISGKPITLNHPPKRLSMPANRPRGGAQPRPAL